MSAFKNRLKAMKKVWTDSKEGSAFTSIEPGNYRAQVQNVELKESVSSGKLMIHREFLIMDGELQGEVIHDNMMLETEKGPIFIRMWIEMMGYECPDDPEDLEDTLKTIAEDAAICKVRVTESGGYNNVRVLKVEETPGSSDEGANEEDTSDAGEEVEEEAEEGTEETDGEDTAGTEEPTEDDDLFDEAVAFCQAQEIDLADEEDIDSLKEKISENGYQSDLLAENEIKLLKDLGLEECIVEPEKKKVEKKATPAKKKVVKKSVKKPASKTAAKKKKR